MENKRKISICFLLFIMITFYGCSWKEYFIIINETDKEIELSYELKELGIRIK